MGEVKLSLNRFSLFSLGITPLFNMLIAIKNTNTDLPLLGFCNEFLIGTKYVQRKLALGRRSHDKSFIANRFQE